MSKTLFLSCIILIIFVFSVFGIAIATIMQCFVADEEVRFYFVFMYLKLTPIVNFL